MRKKSIGVIVAAGLAITMACTGTNGVVNAETETSDPVILQETDDNDENLDDSYYEEDEDDLDDSYYEEDEDDLDDSDYEENEDDLDDSYYEEDEDDLDDPYYEEDEDNLDDSYYEEDEVVSYDDAEENELEEADDQADDIYAGTPTDAGNINYRMAKMTENQTEIVKESDTQSDVKADDKGVQQDTKASPTDSSQYKKTGVQTGDDFMVGEAVAGMLLSLGAAGLIAGRKRNR